MYACEILTDAQYWQYLKEKYYTPDTCEVVDKTFLKNVMWRYNELIRLRQFYDKYKSLVEGQKIKEEMGL